MFDLKNECAFKRDGKFENWRRRFQNSWNHSRSSYEKWKVSILISGYLFYTFYSFSAQSDGLENKNKLIEYLKSRGPFQNWSSVGVECPDLMSVFEYVLVGSPNELNDKVNTFK